MKILLSFCMMIFSTVVLAGETVMPAQVESPVITGEVLEVIAVENFTYLRINTHAGEIWTAVVNAPVKKGNVVSIKDAIVMKNFESKILKRTFSTILFGNLVGAPSAGGQNASSPMPIGMGSSFIALSHKWRSGTTKIQKANEAGSLTVAEIVKDADKFEGKSVVVRGKVVKYNPDIMGKNWIHLRDGSGSELEQTNDILVTSSEPVQPGDVVTFRGKVRTNQNFGAGYAYKVLIEEAVKQ